MFNIIFWLLVGMFIGWNIPQPSYAKSFQEKFIFPVINWVKNKLKF